MAGERRRSGTADAASWWCGLALAALLLLVVGSLAGAGEERGGGLVVRGARLATRPCEEIYVVGEGETLHSISARCGDPYILEKNPHVQDPDDVFPGLVIWITPP
ncbi:uncharacterized protein LOC133903047 [Phragmites australis]|uniref:uncharacterized protein LOC133903047 n=1 Tax=Phragmites australis TaxID=29695 RepID=UPI002D77870F|nr:uncharacterized protein LOC133903047 [Phragmites australis]